MPAFQDDELLAKRNVLQHQVLARTKVAKGGSEPDPEKVEHSRKVTADRILIRALMSLISRSDAIVASDTPKLPQSLDAQVSERRFRPAVRVGVQPANGRESLFAMNFGAILA